MSLKEIQAIASSEVVFGILFIVFFVWFLKKYNDERGSQRISDLERDKYMAELHKQREETLITMMAEARLDTLNREAKLTNNMNRMVDTQERIGDTLKEVSVGLLELEKKVDNNVLELWKVMAQQSSTTPKQ